MIDAIGEVVFYAAFGIPAILMIWAPVPSASTYANGIPVNRIHVQGTFTP
jgi:hypothetical protein